MRLETKRLYDREAMKRCKQAADNRCVRCHALNDPTTGHTLTAAHLDANPGNNNDWNLAALCQRCHLHLEGYNPFAGVTIDNYDFLLTHCDRWFIPHLKGYIWSQPWGCYLRLEGEISPEGGAGDSK